MSTGREAGQPGRRGWLVGVAAAALVLATYREDLAGRVLAPVVLWTAEATASVLRWLGVSVWTDRGILGLGEGFSYEVYFRCTGYLPAALLAIGVLAWPSPLRRRLVGVGVGVPALLILNLARLVHLFLVGTARPALFPLVHGVLWEGGMVAAVLGLWWTWKKWATMDVTLSKGFTGAGP